MQVLLEASDLAGISVFLAMLIACTVAIILLPIETKGKSLRVSQCVLQEGFMWPMPTTTYELRYMFDQYCTFNVLNLHLSGNWKHAIQKGCTRVLPSRCHCV